MVTYGLTNSTCILYNNIIVLFSERHLDHFSSYPYYNILPEILLLIVSNASAAVWNAESVCASVCMCVWGGKTLPHWGGICESMLKPKEENCYQLEQSPLALSTTVKYATLDNVILTILMIQSQTWID